MKDIMIKKSKKVFESSENLYYITGYKLSSDAYDINRCKIKVLIDICINSQVLEKVSVKKTMK